MKYGSVKGKEREVPKKKRVTIFALHQPSQPINLPPSPIIEFASETSPLLSSLPQCSATLPCSDLVGFTLPAFPRRVLQF
jgi:hypothetical protein